MGLKESLKRLDTKGRPSNSLLKEVKYPRRSGMAGMFGIESDEDAPRHTVKTAG